MPNELQQHEKYLSCLALQWITYMSDGRTKLANRLLAHHCGLLGFDIAKHSTVYTSARTVKKLPNLTTRRIFAAKNAVVLDVELASATSTEDLYNVYFRFQFARITKVHFSRMDEFAFSSMEGNWFQLDLDEVRLQAWLD